MTPIALANAVWTTRRGVGVVIVALVFGIVALLYSLAENPARTVQYGSATIAPEQASYCPGDVMRYPVHVVVEERALPSVSLIFEGWYSVERGVVIRETVTETTIPLVRPVDTQATAVRVVPYLPPGEYWYDHVSRNGSVEAYTVGPVEVLDCGE